MEYILEVKFEDKNYNAIIHFLTTFIVKTEKDARLMVDEIVEGFQRNGAIVLNGHYDRIDDDEIKRDRQYQYHRFCMQRANATVEIEQFILDKPDPKKSLFDNLSEKIFKGENSTASIGKKFNIPVRVTEKDTRKPLDGEIFYCTIEHLIPRSQL